MKAKYFKRLRKNFKDPKWVAKKYRAELEESRALNSFYKFECSDFFRGYGLAEYNREQYRIRTNKNNARLNYLKKYCMSL